MLHGEHCYSAEGTLVCGWPEEHDAEPRPIWDRELDDLRFAYTHTDEGDPDEDRADLYAPALRSLGLVR